MNTLKFNNYKVAKVLPIDRIIDFFRLPKVLKWKECVILEQQHIETILNCPAEDKKVFVFSFGCVTLVNFKEEEIHKVLRFIESIVGKLDYTLFAKFYENHLIEILEQGSEKNKVLKLTKNSEKYIGYNKALVEIVAVIIAKSTALDKIEMDLNHLLDTAENYIVFLQKGKLRMKTKEFKSISSKLLRFEYDIINNIRIFDREAFDGNNTEIKESYLELENYYEFNDRINIIENKINNLRTIVRNYNKLSYEKSENRLYWFEAFLLALFPIMYIIKLVPNKYNFFK